MILYSLLPYWCCIIHIAYSGYFRAKEIEIIFRILLLQNKQSGALVIVLNHVETLCTDRKCCRKLVMKTGQNRVLYAHLGYEAR